VWQTVLQKEIVRKKIRDKAIIEGASAVILLTDVMAPSVLFNEALQKGRFLLSGATPDLNAYAFVAYALDKQTRTMTFSEMEWSDEQREEFFLDGIFRGDQAVVKGV